MPPKPGNRTARLFIELGFSKQTSAYIVLLGFLRGLVTKLAIVHKTTDGWLCVWGNLNQINAAAFRQPESIIDSHDTKLTSSLANYAHLRCSNLTVHAYPNLSTPARPSAERRLRFRTVQNIDEIFAAR